jgi:hypothetical protein|tara:strand:+ start:115 stop:432 length:318 start_codon:yes stop_codon:yes gene_type:complete
VVASRSARARKAGVEAGPLSRVRIEVGPDDSFVYRIACTACTTATGSAWSTHRRGEDNGYLAAMDRWSFHLVEKHPGAEAPCLVHLPAAQQRLHESREQRDGSTD